MPRDWRDIRFDTGAKFGYDQPAGRGPMVNQTNYNFPPLDWGSSWGPHGGGWIPRDIQFPPWPDDEFNSDPGADDNPLVFSMLSFLNAAAQDSAAGGGIGLGFGLPDWFVLTDDLAGGHGVQILATVLALLIEGLPTSDPGGGLVWLSPS